MGRFKEKGETKGILRRKKGVGTDGGEKADAEEAQRQVSGPGGEASGHCGQVSAWSAWTSRRWCRT